jgi:hypothetical protein
MKAIEVLLVLAVLFVVFPFPIYLIGSRRGVSHSWVAFVPFVGATITWLWAIDKSGWMTVIAFIPLVNVIFGIWLCFAMPPHHGRTAWWGVPLLLLPWVGTLWYALTLEHRGASTATWLEA